MYDNTNMKENIKTVERINLPLSQTLCVTTVWMLLCSMGKKGSFIYISPKLFLQKAITKIWKRHFLRKNMEETFSDKETFLHQENLCIPKFLLELKHNCGRIQIR